MATLQFGIGGAQGAGISIVKSVNVSFIGKTYIWANRLLSKSAGRLSGAGFFALSFHFRFKVSTGVHVNNSQNVVFTEAIIGANAIENSFQQTSLLESSVAFSDPVETSNPISCQPFTILDSSSGVGTY